MKKITIVLVFSLLFAGGVQGQESAELNKAINLANQASEAIVYGNFIVAKTKCKKSLKIIETEIGTNNIQYIMVVHILNSAYLLGNELDKAKKRCIENCERCDKYKDEYPYIYRSTYSTLASLYARTNELTKAFSIFYNIMMLAPAGSCEEIDLMLNIVKVLVKMGHFQDAQFLSLSALKRYEHNLCDKKSTYPTILKSLGGIYLNLGLYQ